jgi:small-conductance mechanosensitive channel
MNFKLILSLLLVLTFGYTQAQDSTQSQAQDSALDANQNQKNKLIAMADSARIADSLEKVALTLQLENLRANDVAEKNRLQRRLDSMALMKSRRDSISKARIDSLRSSTTGVPVVFHKDTILFIYSKLGPFSPSERVARVQDKLGIIADDPTYDSELFKTFLGEESYDIMYEDVIVMSVTDRDAFWLDIPKKEMANHTMEKMAKAIEFYQSDTSIYKTLLRIGLILLVIIVFFFIVRTLNRTFSKLVIRVARSSNQYMNGIKLRDYEFLSPERELQVVVWLMNAFKWLVILIILYISLPIVFSIFPTTEGIAKTLLGYVTKPMMSMIMGLIGFIPELIAIVVIATVARYVVRFLKFLASEVENGKLVLNGFYPDWAIPTYSLLRVLIYAFAFIMIFPYLPGSDSPVFQGVSVFLGLLISLGSSSAIGNIIAGLVITYMRPFKVGERVKIGDITGDVIEKNMLVTRVRTIKNEDVSIPNAAILNGSTVNYSSSAKDLGLILHTTITIGYDVPWTKVHELMIEAALKCDLILKEPKPFVLQTSLDDFYVSYQINAYTEHADKGSKIYSEIHTNIQDGFNEAGVEILSPHYRAQRDGSMVTTPANYLPDDYQAPPFNINVRKDG